MSFLSRKTPFDLTHEARWVICTENEVQLALGPCEADIKKTARLLDPDCVRFLARDASFIHAKQKYHFELTPLRTVQRREIDPVVALTESGKQPQSHCGHIALGAGPLNERVKCSTFFGERAAPID